MNKQISFAKKIRRFVVTENSWNHLMNSIYDMKKSRSCSYLHILIKSSINNTLWTWKCFQWKAKGTKDNKRFLLHRKNLIKRRMKQCTTMIKNIYILEFTETGLVYSELLGILNHGSAESTTLRWVEVM